MRRVKVLKEMPFAKVGEEINTLDFCFLIAFGGTQESLIKDGWLEYVEEEKTLEEKIKEQVITTTSCSTLNDTSCKSLSQIAKEHYLEVFDKATIRSVSTEAITIRKALEDA